MIELTPDELIDVIEGIAVINADKDAMESYGSLIKDFFARMSDEFPQFRPRMTELLAEWDRLVEKSDDLAYDDTPGFLFERKCLTGRVARLGEEIVAASEALDAAEANDHP